MEGYAIFKFLLYSAYIQKALIFSLPLIEKLILPYCTLTFNLIIFILNRFIRLSFPKFP